MTKPGFTFVDRRVNPMQVAHANMLASIEDPSADGSTDEDTSTLTLHNLYAKGLSAADVDDVTPNTLLLLPLRRPAVSAGGVVTAVDEHKGTRGTNCIAYVVAGIGDEQASADQHPQTWLPVSLGDVVIVRTAMLEPLHPDQEPLSVHRRHVLAKVRLALD